MHVKEVPAGHSRDVNVAAEDLGQAHRPRWERAAGPLTLASKACERHSNAFIKPNKAYIRLYKPNKA